MRYCVLDKDGNAIGNEHGHYWYGSETAAVREADAAHKATGEHYTVERREQIYSTASFDDSLNEAAKSE